MSTATITAASALAALIASLPSRTVWECQEQDLAVADVLQIIADACAGNGDAEQILTRAIEDIRATVAMDRERDAERRAA